MSVLIPGFQLKTVTIASGQTVSDAADIGQFTLTGIKIPDDVEGTELTFHGSVDGTNFFPINSPETAGSSIAAAISSVGAIIPLITDNFVGIQYLKVVSDSAQTGDAEIDLLTVRATEGRG